MIETVRADDEWARFNLLQAIKLAASTIDRSDFSLKNLSLKLGKNPAYLHQYLYRHSPKVLPEQLRLKLAQLLNVNEQLLRPKEDHDQGAIDGTRNVAISFLEHPAHQDQSNAPWFLPQPFLSAHTQTPVDKIYLAMVGDSAPSLNMSLGDVVMLDTADKAVIQAGIFGIDMGEHIRVRHLEQASASSPSIMVSASNGSSYELLADASAIIGRVIFHAQLFDTPTSKISSNQTSKAIL